MTKRQLTVDYTITLTQDQVKELYEILVMSKIYDRIDELKPLYYELNKMYHNDYLQDLG